MAFDIDKFREDFPEFSKSGLRIYSDSLIAFWAKMGDLQLNVKAWGDLLDFGMELYVAHNIVLAVTAQDTATLGGVPGQDIGVMTSQSADGLQVSLDVNSMLEANAGNYNLTFYGRQFLRLARLLGSGGAVAI